MKIRAVSLLLVMSLLLSFPACTQRDRDTATATVTFSKVGADREVSERAGAFAVDQYVYARLKTDALIESASNAEDPEVLSSLIEEVLQIWLVTEAAANHAEQISVIPINMREAPTKATASVVRAAKVFHPFSIKAYAAEEDTATAWAKEITKKFDSYPANARIRSLAKELGVDARNAYQQLQMAQDILKGNAEREEGDLYKAVETALIATRTVCKTTLYVTGAIASGGTASALEMGSMVIGGVDTVVDIAATGSTIFRGENDKVTLTLNEVKDYLAPVSSISGGVSFFSSGIGKLESLSDKMGLLDKFTYVGDGLLDYFQEGKVLGIHIGEKDNTAEMTLTEIDASENSPESVEKALDVLDLTLPSTSAPKSAVRIVSDMEANMGGAWTVETVQDYFDKLTAVLEQQPAGESAPEGTDTLPSQTETEHPVTDENTTTSNTAEELPGDIPAIEEIPGTYHMVGNSDAGATLDFYMDFVLQNGELHAIIDEEDQSVIHYDASTGRAVVPGITSGSFFAFRKQEASIQVYYEVDWSNGVWWHLHSIK